MKKGLYSVVFALVALLMVSCDSELTSYDESTITYYPTVEIEGESVIWWTLGETYVDPGCYAEMQGEDVTDQIVISGDVDANTAGIYNLTYTVVNSDGFSASASRTVYVAATGSTIESGSWYLAPGSYRDYSGTLTSFSGYEMTILALGNDEYWISDYIGGYYDQGVGYGSAYAMTGTFTLNADNTITENGDSYVSGWGDWMDSMSNGKYDPATGEIYWEVGYASVMTFYITLTK